MAFYRDLKQFALAASEAEHEGPVTEMLQDKLGDYADSMETDKMGNLYVVRKGRKMGMVMLSAHQDKVMHTAMSGAIVPYIERLESNLVFPSRMECLRAMRGSMYVFTEDGYEALKKRMNRMAEPVRMTLPQIMSGRFIDETGSYYIPAGFSVDDSGLEAGGEPVSLYCLSYRKSGGSVNGKMDDAMGLSLVTEVLQSTRREETPSIVAVFTTQEEDGRLGSEYCVHEGMLEEYTPDRIIVLDVTPLEKPGSGIVLYENCLMAEDMIDIMGFSDDILPDDLLDDYDAPLRSRASGAVQVPQHMARRFERQRDNRRYKRSHGRRPESKEEHIAEIEAFAKEMGFPLKTVQSFINDSTSFAQTGIPTCALEVPVADMHNAVETCSVADIESMRKFLRAYITK